MMPWIRPILVALLFSLNSFVCGDVLRIEPYAQWTFDAPLERIIYRSNSSGFPIKYTINPHHITYYDSLGNKVFQYERTPGDAFQMNEDESAFMLVQQHESNQADNPQRLYSFQVYDFEGKPAYTHVHSVESGDKGLRYELTKQKSLLLSDSGQPWILEVSDEDTLLFMPSVVGEVTQDCDLIFVSDKLNHRNEMVTASSCLEDIDPDSMSLELRLWIHDIPLGEPVVIPGRLAGLKSLSGTDYYFLEIDYGFESSLTLFNRDNMLGKFPWKTWDIRSLDQSAAFVISESDLNVVNLGDGSLISSFHPIDISTISDATYLPEWGLYLYIRYEPFFTESGQQAYRKFELEGVNKTGRIAHRSSFGSWSTSLPKLSQIQKDLFAIHIHNAVLLYRVELERN